MWLVITSQEKLTELVGGLDNTRVELARLMDRMAASSLPMPWWLSACHSTSAASSKTPSPDSELVVLLRGCRLVTAAPSRYDCLSVSGSQTEPYPAVPRAVHSSASA